MRFICGFALAALVSTSGLAEVQSILTPFEAQEDEAIVLKNDGFVESGGQAYLQLGFVKGEMAGVWVKVPQNIQNFKVDFFRILIGSADMDQEVASDFVTQGFFQMGVANAPSTMIPRSIENAVQLTPGPYWNDIPAKGARDAALPCVSGGQYIGAAFEFTHEGAPSVYRDIDGLAAPNHNTLMAIPGGWNYSVAYGLRGDWVLRIVGHEAAPGEC